ncbi:MAG: hypothetical protein ABGZ53_23680 [Fuerstiella sp.]
MSDDPYKAPTGEPEHVAAPRSRLIRTAVITVIGLIVGVGLVVWIEDNFFSGIRLDWPLLLKTWILSSVIGVVSTWFVFKFLGRFFGKKKANVDTAAD